MSVADIDVHLAQLKANCSRNNANKEGPSIHKSPLPSDEDGDSTTHNYDDANIGKLNVPAADIEVYLDPLKTSSRNNANTEVPSIHKAPLTSNDDEDGSSTTQNYDDTTPTTSAN